MDRMLVVVFSSEDTAAEGRRVLAALHEAQTITRYAAALVAKDADGVMTVRDVPRDDNRDHLLAMATDRLVALLQRPTTALGATMADLAGIGVATTFVEEVRRRVAPGTVALVAEIEESWVLPVDVRMGQLGGDVLRHSRVPVIDALIHARLATREAELADLECELAHTEGDGRARLQAQLTEAQGQLDAARSMAQHEIDTQRREAEAKIWLLHQQAAHASDGWREMIERQIAAIRAGYVERAARLRTAWQITGGPLSI